MKILKTQSGVKFKISAIKTIKQTTIQLIQTGIFSTVVMVYKQSSLTHTTSCVLLMQSVIYAFDFLQTILSQKIINQPVAPRVKAFDSDG